MTCTQSPPAEALICATFAIVIGCGGTTSSDARAHVPTPPRPAPSASSIPPPAASTRDPEIDARRAWALSVPDHANASIELVEWSAFEGEPIIRVVARDGDTVLDAWVDDDASAPAYWRVAEVVELARRRGIERFERGPRWTLVGIDGSTMFCADAAGGPCYSLPTSAWTGTLSCGLRSRCTLHAESVEGRVEEWQLEPARRRWRVVRSWPARPAEVQGPWDAGARDERGRWESLVLRDRPAVIDEAALALPPWNDADDEEHADDEELADEPEAPCVPTVRSVRLNDTVVRVVGCGDPPLDSRSTWPTAIIVTRAGRMDTTPLFFAEPGPPFPQHILPLGELASAAIGLVAWTTDGGSPSGGSSEDLWVILPGSARTIGAGVGEPTMIHRLAVGSDQSIGLGNEGDGQGYVVGIDRVRMTFEPTGPGRGRYIACQRWSGTHARISDRWEGARRAESLDIPVTFDPERGFETSEADREILRTRCTPD